MTSNYQTVVACRMCGNKNLVEVIDLGCQYLTGVFPRNPDGVGLTNGPLQLVKCHGGAEACGLVQLRHNYSPDEMYGENYGYRSGLNPSMVAHLRAKVDAIIDRVAPGAGDLVIDIGSNDGTTLAAFPPELALVGIDPVARKFQHHYPPHVTLIPDFFSAELVAGAFPGRRAKIITSFSMVYDLEDPVAFASEIASLLDEHHGIWVFEQSYLPLMLERTAFDTICHEHIEYYGLRQIAWMLERAGMHIIDVELNDVNGGSFSVVAAKMTADYVPNAAAIARLFNYEDDLQVDALATYDAFRASINDMSRELKAFLEAVRREGKRVCGLGASTKGNVLLQYCGLTGADIEVIGELNPDKFGAVTPGSWIPIDDEAKVLASRPEYLIVLPWHFRAGFLSNPAYKGLNLVFPLPRLEVVRT